ncbi:hypothetical protein BC939DRAFT_456265 [Gamsiella multidivaricata]|uniref:uncharacterized protein n=1 Tax=Gamsiella multidivaricata TaxID=101098 RepID=UPI0022201A18|nr:uncharacterized protein BC939DRAFT_456265 [Gamsiella multidivaricata]KAI7821246.1 hypothetical protein BC939DRAFT_456265 [Gamsiella multidivaricata]
MRNFVGVTAAVLLVAASNTVLGVGSGAEAGAETGAEGVVVVGTMNEILNTFRVPIEKINGTARLSTVSRWSHTLRKYGLSHRHRHRHRANGPQGHQRGQLEGNATNLARIPLVDHDQNNDFLLCWSL